jgi:hypothetical protein
MSLKSSISRKPIVRGIAFAVWVLVLAAACPGQSSISPYRDPVDLVRRAVQNEIAAANSTSHFEFRGTKTTSKGSATRLYVETKEATAGLVIAYNGVPLTPDQRRDEESRIDRFVSNPEELQKKRQQERENNERTMRITSALPDAFIYEYAGEEPGSPGIGRVGTLLVKLTFHPNPHYEPPSRVEEILTGMKGFLLIDTNRYRLAAIDGTLFKEVGFGWGILGHLDKGGRFVVHQQEVGDNSWEFTSLTLHFTGRVMLFKSLVVDSTEVFDGFKQVPSDLTFAQALDLLKKDSQNLAATSTVSRLATR